MSASWQRGLYAVTDSALTPPGYMVEQVRAALAGGAVLIQYRDKRNTGREKATLAAALLAVCRAAGAPLIINDDVELAAAIGADGIHLGRDDPSPAEARRRLGPEAIIGVSCYNELARGEAAATAGADYIAFGRFFASPTKPDAAAADPALLQHARRCGVPVVAIGGITAANGGALIAAGADLLAVIHGVFGQPDVERAAAEITALFSPPAVRASVPATAKNRAYFKEFP